MKKNNTKENVTFYQNPFYDSLFGVLNESVPSKIIHFSGIGEKIRIISSNKARNFEKAFKDWVKKEDKWPYSGSLLIAVSICLSKREYKEKDVDNMLKAMLDAMKGVVYIDDNQVQSVFIEKRVSEKPSWFVGIKHIEKDSNSWFLPILFSEKPFVNK